MDRGFPGLFFLLLVSRDSSGGNPISRRGGIVRYVRIGHTSSTHHGFDFGPWWDRECLVNKHIGPQENKCRNQLKPPRRHPTRDHLADGQEFLLGDCLGGPALRDRKRCLCGRKILAIRKPLSKKLAALLTYMRCSKVRKYETHTWTCTVNTNYEVRLCWLTTSEPFLGTCWDLGSPSCEIAPCTPCDG